MNHKNNNPVNSIPEAFQHLIPKQAVSEEILTKISADSRHIAALRKAASQKTLTEYDAHQMEALIALVMRKDEATGRSLAILALEMLRDLVVRELQGGNPPEAGECHDKDSGMIPPDA